MSDAKIRRRRVLWEKSQLVAGLSDMPRIVSKREPPRHHVYSRPLRQDGPEQAKSHSSRPLSFSNSQILSARPKPQATSPAEKAMPPKTAVLRWPNGATTPGRLAESTEARLSFLAGEAEGPLAERCMRADRIAWVALDPGAIEVALAPGGSDGNVVQVEPMLLEAVPGIDPEALRDLAWTAGGKTGGLSTDDQVALSKMLEGVLSRLEDNAVDPGAVRRAREALKRPFIELMLKPGADGQGHYQCKVSNAEGDNGSRVGDLGKALEGLEEGEHLYLRASQEDEEDEHAMAICATRLPGERVQISVFNSNGWATATGNPFLARFPAVAKTVSLDDAVAALRAFPTGIVKPSSTATQRVHPAWQEAEYGMPLLAWLGSVDPQSGLWPTGQHMRPQKGDDCAIEVEFAWLASVLPEADYKLAKANALNVLTQAAVANKLEEDVVQRLRERLTSSLSAHVMAMGT